MTKKNLGLSLIFFLFILPSISQAKDINFVVAGHTYGSSQESNVGLYPKFLRRYSQLTSPVDFLVLTGDFVRRCHEQSWQLAMEDLEYLETPFHIALGNHDISDYCREQHAAKYGANYYSFEQGDNLFVMLDSQESPRSIAENQIRFLEDVLEKSSAKRVFLFFHELLWIGNYPRYRQVRGNSRSRYQELWLSNYWSDIHPMLKRYALTEFYVFAGDTGHYPGSIPAFYDNVDNVHLIASGMGGLQDENFIYATISGDDVAFALVGLNDRNMLRPLKFYTPSLLSALDEDLFMQRLDLTGDMESWQLWALFCVFAVSVLFSLFWLRVKKR